MLIDIKDDHCLPSGRYALMNLEKIQRAKQVLGANADERAILLEYDKMGGFIVEVFEDIKLTPQTLWQIEQKHMNDSLENLSDAELLAIIRRGENTNVPGGRYQRAQAEIQIRHNQRLIEAMKGGRGGLSIQVGGNMHNDGSILTDPGSPVDIAVAGNYTSNKGRIVQGGSQPSDDASTPEPSLIGLVTNNQTFAIVVGGLVLLLLVGSIYYFSGINLSNFE